MPQISGFSSPFLLGFDDIERRLNRVTKASNDGYPPYNIERFQSADERTTMIRITLAVAGFSTEDLEATIEDNQLVVQGKQQDHDDRDFLHRGIAARHFQKAFVLADGLEVVSAELENGLLKINLAQPEPEIRIRTIEIQSRG